MTPAEIFQAAYDAFLADYNSKVAQIASLQTTNAQLQARLDGLLALIDQTHALAHAPLVP